VQVYIHTVQNEQLIQLSKTTGIDASLLLDEALKLFLERWEYVLRHDPYVPKIESEHYPTLVSSGHRLEIDLSCSPGNAIDDFLLEHLSLNPMALSYVVRKALALLFEGKKPLDKKMHC
jgi:hypothetical protein